jgi:hypothetical protein
MFTFLIYNKKHIKNVNYISNFAEYIAEKYLLPKTQRVKNLLYHASSMNSIFSILKDNELRGTSGYDYGVATSRSKDYLFLLNFEDGNIIRGGADAQLILDREKLKTKYKVVPFDWEEFKLIDDPNYHQAEDKVMTSAIENLDRFVVGIQLNRSVHRNFQILWNDSEIKEKIITNKWNVFDTKWNLLVENGELVQETKPKYNYTIHEQNEYYMDATLDTPKGKIMITGQFSEDMKELDVVAYHNNIRIGSANFQNNRLYRGRLMDMKNIHVEESFRRIGIASVMLDIAIMFTKTKNINIEPEYKSHDDVKALWNSF